MYFCENYELVIREPVILLSMDQEPTFHIITRKLFKTRPINGLNLLELILSCLIAGNCVQKKFIKVVKTKKSKKVQISN